MRRPDTFKSRKFFAVNPCALIARMRERSLGSAAMQLRGKESDMVNKTLMLLVALALVCVTSRASAADLCVKLGGGGQPSVLKGATQPMTSVLNTCTPLAGFEDIGIVDPGQSAGGRITASACVD